MRVRRWLFGAVPVLTVLALQGTVGALNPTRGAAEQVPKLMTVASAPPVVIRTVPEAGLLDVAPGAAVLKVEFSKDMMTEQMWSVVKVSGASFPELAGGASFMKDKRTFTLPVSLEPETTYAMWFNSKGNNAFRDLSNNPAVPYFLVFRTGR